MKINEISTPSIPKTSTELNLYKKQLDAERKKVKPIPDLDKQKDATKKDKSNPGKIDTWA